MSESSKSEPIESNPINKLPDIPVTGVLQLPLTPTLTFDPACSLQLIASECFKHLATKAKEAFDLDTPLVGAGSKIAVYKCVSGVTLISASSHLLFLAAGIVQESSFQEPIPNVKFDNNTSTNSYIIMYSMPPANTGFVEDYVKKYNKENHAVAVRGRLIQEEEGCKLANKKEKEKGKDCDLLGRSWSSPS